MQIGEEQEIAIGDFFKLCKEEGGAYQIGTPDGWQNVVSLVEKHNKECYNLIFDDGNELGCSDDHFVLTDNFGWVSAEKLDVEKHEILTRDGSCGIVAKEFLGTKKTFDLEVGGNRHRYYSNEIISHNTGKSAVCDALADLYQMPLLRLDFGAVFSAHVGDSEKNIRDCLSTAENVAPCVLWLDEVEKGIGGVESSNATDGGVTNRVFGTMLTWMQDKTAPVFVACTANNILGLPPEFMRAGRFDEIFFIDLPDEDQRYEVTQKLLSRKGRNPDDFDINKIVSASKNYTPVEIEKGIDNALFVAYSEKKRKLTSDDIAAELKKFFPLYNSRREEIDAMREWALGKDGMGGRAVMANSQAKPSQLKNIDPVRSLDLDP